MTSRSSYYGRNGCDNDYRPQKNNIASITGDVTGSVTEDSGSRAIARGELCVKDKDRGEAGVKAISNKAGTYGTFSIDASGNWTYRIDNSKSAFQSLDSGEKAYEKFDVWSLDGSTKKTITVTVNGADEARQSGADIGGNDRGEVTEDAPVNVDTGRLTINGKEVSSGFTTMTKAGTYGTFKLLANGSWTYTLDNSKAVTQALAEGQAVTESFTVSASTGNYNRCGPSGTDTHVVKVTVFGTGEQVGVGGNLTGQVTEDGNAQSTATGKLTLTGSSAGVTFDAGDYAGDLGLLQLAEDGNWTYSLDNSLDAVQELAQGQTTTDVVTIQTSSGVTKDITVTVRGTNDTPEGADDSYFMAADFFGKYGAANYAVTANDFDIDLGAVLSVQSASATSALGAVITRNADGTLRYDASTVSALDVAQTDSFSYVLVDQFGASDVVNVQVTLVGAGVE